MQLVPVRTATFNRRLFRFESHLSAPSIDPDPVDIIALTVRTNGEAPVRTTIRTSDDLTSFIQSTEDEESQSQEHILLIQDISNEATDILKSEIGFSPSVAEKHGQGRVNDLPGKPTKFVPHSERLEFTLFDRTLKAPDKSCQSLSWWRLLTQTMEGNKHEEEAFVESHADFSKVVAPIFPVEIEEQHNKEYSDVRKSDKWYSRWASNTNRTLTGGGFVSWEQDQGDTYEESIFKLDCHTYRPHQVVTEVSNKMWASACEERVTFCNIRTDIARFWIILFDKERQLKQHDREIQVEETKRGFVWDSVSSRPLAKIMSEKPEGSRLTFSNSTQSVLEQPELDAEAETISNSTRARFMRSLNTNPVETNIAGDELVMVELRRRITNIIAEDWNLVLSQMRQTLDGIDGKISDDHALQENVTAWRRILCSWRVNIIEYSSRLSTVHRLAEQQAYSRHGGSISGSPQTRRAERQDSSTYPTIDEATIEIVDRFEILKAGMVDIAGRVDRSFQALMSSMSIVESEKAISQGIQVARLTELAFFFIPLSFACSFFSMQITNFSGPNMPSIGPFFGLGIGLVTILYGLRAFLRSSTLAKVREKLEKEVRKTSGLPPSSKIPTRVVLNYGWQEINPYLRVFLVTLPAFALIMTLVFVFSREAAFRVLVAVDLVLGAIPIIGHILAGNVRTALRWAVGVAWLIAIFSVTVERLHHLEVIVTTVACVILTSVFIVILAFIPGSFRRPVTSPAHIILALFMILLPIAGILHSYRINHWEPWVLTISIQAIVIFFGIVVALFDLNFYDGIPELASLMGLTVGIPASMVWQYMPSHGNPIPQWAVIVVTFSCSVAFCAFLWLIPRLRRFGNDENSISMAVQVFAIFGATAGIPIALAWAYYPTYGKFYTNASPLLGGQKLSMFYGEPIHLWIQVSITLGAAVWCAFATFVQGVLIQSSFLLWLAWAISGAALTPWLPILLYIDDIDAFRVLAESHWKRKVLTAMSVVFWVITWSFLYQIGSRYVEKIWPETRTPPPLEHHDSRAGSVNYDPVGTEDMSTRAVASTDHAREQV